MDSELLRSEVSSVISADVVNDKAIKKRVYFVVKRLFDVLSSSLGLIILSPVLLFIALAIKIESKGSAIYKHKRVGKNGKTIYLYKFRSMYNDAEDRLAELLDDPEVAKEWNEHFKLSKDPRITKIGKFIRKTSLDELPQLLNIIKGDMSVVGPRPIVLDELEKYGMLQKKFLSVTPGLTGWWACNGRSCTSYEDRIILELYYINHMSTKLDIKVIFKTIIAVIIGRGAK